MFNHIFAPYYSGDESLPSSWHTCVLSDVCHIKGGKRLPADCEFSEGCTDHPYIRIRDMYQGKYIELSNDFEYIDEPVFLQISRYTVSAGDIIIAIVGITSGEVAIIGDTLEGANLTENCVKLTNFQKVTPEYIYCYWQYLRNSGGIDPLLVGAAQPKLPMYNIQSVPILIPDQDTMQLFEKRSATISARVGANLNEIHKLQELQNLMVSRLSSH